MDADKLASEVRERSKDGRIACSECFKIAADCDVSVAAVGEACNDQSIKIAGCQLGCFK